MPLSCFGGISLFVQNALTGTDPLPKSAKQDFDGRSHNQRHFDAVSAFVASLIVFHGLRCFRSGMQGRIPLSFNTSLNQGLFNLPQRSEQYCRLPSPHPKKYRLNKSFSAARDIHQFFMMVYSVFNVVKHDQLAFIQDRPYRAYAPDKG